MKKKKILKFLEKVLAQLNSTLMSKSDVYADVYLRSIFKLNNNHHILKSLQRSELLDLLKCSEPECEKNYFDMIQDNKKKYMQRYKCINPLKIINIIKFNRLINGFFFSWGKVLSYIWNSEEVSQTQYGKFKDKDRHVIKEKFAVS
mgnify:CR=1 FL=1